jgi:hypothetical protein
MLGAGAGKPFASQQTGRVVRPGAFVRCAVTGLPIPLEELKYWSVDLQEAYVNPEAVLQRHVPNARRRTTEDTGR